MFNETYETWQSRYDRMEPDCFECTHDFLNTSELEKLRERFCEAVKILCNDGELDIEYLDDCLGQMSDILNIQYSPNCPKVERPDLKRRYNI